MTTTARVLPFPTTYTPPMPRTTPRPHDITAPDGWDAVRPVTHPDDAERWPEVRVLLVRSRVTGVYSTWTGFAFRAVAQAWARRQAEGAL